MEQFAQDQWSIVTSQVSYPELRSVFARLKRDRRAIHGSYRDVLIELISSWAEYLVVTFDAELSQQAGNLTESHPLSGLDAIQLGSALAVSEGLGQKPLFATWDRKLWQAAKSEGFQLVPEHKP